MAKGDTPIFSEATPGDIIRSEEWNLIQRELRYAMRHHRHLVSGDIDDSDGTLDDAVQITTDEIGSLAVTTEKLADGSVTADKIGPDVVTGIEDDAVTESKIADNAVTEGKIADNAVTEGKIADNAVTESKIADNAVTEGKIADNAVSMGKISSAAINSIRSSVITAISEIRWEKIELDVTFEDRAEIVAPLTFGVDFMGRAYLRGVFALQLWGDSELLVGRVPEEISPEFGVVLPLMGQVTLARLKTMIVTVYLQIRETGEVVINTAGMGTTEGGIQFNLDPIEYWLRKTK